MLDSACSSSPQPWLTISSFVDCQSPPSSIVMDVPLRIQPNWNNDQREARLHPTTIAQMHLSAADHVRIAQCMESAPVVPSLCCGFLADASVAADQLVLPLDTCQLMRWKQGTSVCLSRIESIVLPKRTGAASSSAAAAASPVPPRASRVRMRAWKPAVCVEWREPQPSADAAVPAASPSAPFLSPVLAEMLHQQLLQSAGISLRAFSSPNFVVLQWNGLACLAAVASVYTDDADSGDERAVECALIADDTEVVCEVMPSAPSFLPQAASPAASAVSSAAAPRSMFPHLRPAAAVAPASIPVSACFPREWRALHTFMHNALQAHGASTAHGAAAASSSLRSPFGLSWGVPRALLLSGGAGTGKTALLCDLESAADPLRLHIKRIQGSTVLAEAMADEQANVLQRYHAELTHELTQMRASASSSSQTAGLLILEDLDAVLCGDSYQRLATQLLALLERIATSTRSTGVDSSPPPLVLLVVSVKSFDAVPAHFLSSGRFDPQLRMGLLSREQRAIITKQHLTEGLQGSLIPFELAGMPTQRAAVSPAPSAAPTVSQLDTLCTSLGALTPGFIAADLSKLVQYAFLHAARRWDGQSSRSSIRDQSASSSAAATASFDLRWADFADALAHTHPSARSAASKSHMRFQAEDGAEGQDASSWPTVGGYPLLKKRLNMTLHHWLNPSSVSALGLRPISGVLFHGASGTGKSLWASALSKHAGFNFLELSVASLFSQWLGESEATIRNAFRQAAELAPCVLLLDQIESMAGKRDEAGGGAGDGGDGGGASGVDARVLSTLLNELDGVGGRRSGVHVVACCRDLRALDSALLRPGRFDEVIEVGMPNAQDRAEILRIMAKGAGGRTRATALADDVDLEAIAEQAEGLTGADLRELLSSAGMATLRRDVNATSIEQSALVSALRLMTHGEESAS